MPDTKLQYTRSWTNVEDFPHLGFTRNWENPLDYPTYEPDETIVRRDMQSLHNEVRDYINNELIPAVVTSNSTEADRAAAEAVRVEAEQQRVSETEGVVARAAQEADEAAESKTLAQSWAVGSTGARSGEDTNNAKYWAGRAEFIASGNVNSFNGRKGTVLPQSGDYTADMVGAAPAGYGLGGANGFDVAMLNSSHDLNLILGNGWYNWTDPAPANAPDTYCLMRVWSGLGSYTMQECMYGGTMGIVMQRSRNGEAWTEWEYVNPPLLLGGLDGEGNDVNEYRTTERYNGKPVYAKVIECAALPDVGESNRKSVKYLASDPTRVVRYSGRVSYISAPNALYGINVDVAGNRIYFETTKDFYVGSSCTVTVYYTKD